MRSPFVPREELPPDLRVQHDELMSTAISQWPADLRTFCTTGPAMLNGQAMADRVGAWLAGGEPSS